MRFNSDSRHYGDHPGYDAHARAEARDGLPFSGEVGLAPYSALILTQDG